jgi:hypothetical protein
MNVKVIEKELMDPLAEISRENLDLNQIPYDFEHVTLLDNTKPGADFILEYVEENLGNRKFIWVKKPAGAPASIKQLEIAAKSEIVFLALGDCGSCSSWVILDAIRLEKMGTPTISICSDRFSHFAHELAKSHGAENLNILSVEHPIAGLSKEEIVKKTCEIIPSLRYILQIP